MQIEETVLLYICKLLKENLNLCLIIFRITMSGGIEKALEGHLLAATQAMEQQLDAEIERLDKMDEDDLEVSINGMKETGNKIQGNYREIVSLIEQTSTYLQLREKVKCIELEYIYKPEIQGQTSANFRRESSFFSLNLLARLNLGRNCILFLLQT